MNHNIVKFVPAFVIALIVLSAAKVSAQKEPRFVLELEAGAVWQTKNDVQIPNTAAGLSLIHI